MRENRQLRCRAGHRTPAHSWLCFYRLHLKTRTHERTHARTHARKHARTSAREGNVPAHMWVVWSWRHVPILPPSKSPTVLPTWKSQKTRSSLCCSSQGYRCALAMRHAPLERFRCDGTNQGHVLDMLSAVRIRSDTYSPSQWCRSCCRRY